MQFEIDLGFSYAALKHPTNFNRRNCLDYFSTLPKKLSLKICMTLSGCVWRPRKGNATKERIR